MLADLFSVISDAVSEFTNMLVAGVTSITSLFFNLNSTSGNYEPTFLGTIAIISVGAGLVWLVYRLIKGAIKGIGR